MHALPCTNPRRASHRPQRHTVNGLAATSTSFRRALDGPRQCGETKPVDTSRRDNQGGEVSYPTPKDAQSRRSIALGTGKRLRAAFSEALINKVGVSWIHTTTPMHCGAEAGRIGARYGATEEPRVRGAEPPVE